MTASINKNSYLFKRHDDHNTTVTLNMKSSDIEKVNCISSPSL